MVYQPIQYGANTSWGFCFQQMFSWIPQFRIALKKTKLCANTISKQVTCPSKFYSLTQDIQIAIYLVSSWQVGKLLSSYCLFASLRKTHVVSLKSGEFHSQEQMFAVRSESPSVIIKISCISLLSYI